MRLLNWLSGDDNPEPVEPPDHLNAVDRNGKRYTTHTFASRGDWWWGVSILTPSLIKELERDGLLPLTEVKP